MCIYIYIYTHIHRFGLSATCNLAHDLRPALTKSKRDSSKGRGSSARPVACHNLSMPSKSSKVARGWAAFFPDRASKTDRIAFRPAFGLSPPPSPSGGRGAEQVVCNDFTANAVCNVLCKEGCAPRRWPWPFLARGAERGRPHDLGPSPDGNSGLARG